MYKKVFLILFFLLLIPITGHTQDISSYRNLSKSDSDRPLPFGSRGGTATPHLYTIQNKCPKGAGLNRYGPSTFAKRCCPKEDSARAQLLPERTGQAKRVPIWFTILYNNVPYDRNLTTAWGFSCLIEGLEKTILFDTGGDGGILLSNMEKLKVDPQEIDVVVVSHIHWDHRGGLLSLLDKNNNITVYLPVSLPSDFKEKARRKGAKVISVHNPVKICENVYSTGELGTWTRLPDALSRQAIGGQVKEQSLVIDTPKGLIVITGCAHPGVVNIVRNAQELLKKERVYLVLGGFHLLAYSEPQVKRIIKDLKKIGVEKVGPSHCTGGRPIELFREAWGENFFDLGCGAKLDIP